MAEPSTGGTMSSPDKSAPAPAPPDASKTVVRGASLLIVLQIGSRAVTFIANQLLLRFLTAQLLGVSTQLEVYYLSVLFFARESLRVAVQRQETRPASTRKADDDPNARVGRESQAVVNLGYLAVMLGCFVTVGLGWLYLSSADESTVKTPNFLLALRLYAFAAVLELLSEPCFVLMQTRLQFGTRASAESIATFLRCVITFGTAFWASNAGIEFGVLPFAVGQLSYGASLLLVYLWAGTRLARVDGFSVLPKALGSGGQDYVASYFYRPTVSLASSMMAQSLVKHVLTQGDTFLVSILSTPKSQGVYALASNYGGLLARLVLQPIEESSRSYFSRLLSSQDTKTRPSKETALKASQHLHTLLKFYLLLSSIIVSIGPVAAPPLLSLVAGQRWASEGAGEVLAVYCYYIPLLAINGVAEAFVASVASEAQVHRQSAWMGAFSVAFGSAAFFFMRIMDLGASGLVYANCINMLCRIVWSLAFVKSYFARLETPFEIFALQPNAVTSIICLSAPHLIRRVTGVAARASTSFKDLVAIGLAAVPVVLLILFAERRFLLQCYNSARRPKTA